MKKLEIRSRKTVKILQERISTLEHRHIKLFRSMPIYASLPEKEKIPLRVSMAEIQGLENFMCGRDLEEMLKYSVENEHYCGAEGLNKAIKWLTSVCLIQPIHRTALNPSGNQLV
jgi:hypothetical protein